MIRDILARHTVNGASNTPKGSNGEKPIASISRHIDIIITLQDGWAKITRVSLEGQSLPFKVEIRRIKEGMAI